MYSFFTFARWFIRWIIVIHLMLSNTYLVQADVVENTGSCNTNDPTAPCYAHVDDILQGQRRLWPVDDLIVTSSIFTVQTGLGFAGPVNSFLLNTTNSAITLPVSDPHKISTAGEPSFATAVGRVFDLPKDTIVTMTSNILNVSVQVPNSFDIGFDLDPNPNQGFYPIGMTMAEFTGINKPCSWISAAVGPKKKA